MKKASIWSWLALAATLAAAPAVAQTPAARAPTPAPGAPVTAPTAPGNAAPAPTSPATANAPKVELIDINTAGKEQLDRLPGIGPARADAIIKGRPYRGKDDLVHRKIIPSGVYDGIKDRIIARQS